MKAFFLLILSASLFTAQLAAQDVYEFRYTFPGKSDTNIYSSYIVLSGNGTGFARIKTGDVLAEADLMEQPSINGDTNFILYACTDMRMIKGKPSDKPAPTHFWFKNTGKMYYDPWAVSTDVAASAPSSGNLAQGSYLSNDALMKNRPLVLSYFDTAHYYYKNLFTKRGTKGWAFSGLAAKEVRMFLLVVASTYDSSLTPNVFIDAGKVVEAFTDIAENGLGISIFVDSVYGSRYNRAAVETALSRLKPGKNDIVVFYYSGHGFTDQKQPQKQFPFLDLRDPNKRPRPAPIQMAMNIQDIYNAVVAKGARMNLILSDCCNDTVEAKKPKSLIQPPSSKGPVRYFDPNMAQLFMQKKSLNILMTAATRDERAIITPRYSSYFTHFFLESLRSYMSSAKSNPNWYQVMEETKKLTTLFAGKVPCPNGRNCVQTPKILL